LTKNGRVQDLMLKNFIPDLISEIHTLDLSKNKHDDWTSMDVTADTLFCDAQRAAKSAVTTKWN
jgi:hypothetical protein